MARSKSRPSEDLLSRRLAASIDSLKPAVTDIDFLRCAIYSRARITQITFDLNGDFSRRVSPLSRGPPPLVAIPLSIVFSVLRVTGDAPPQSRGKSVAAIANRSQPRFFEKGLLGQHGQNRGIETVAVPLEYP